MTMSPEQPSFNQLNEQFNSGHRDKMTMLLENEDGKVSTGYFTGKKDIESGKFQVEVISADGAKEFKFLSTEDLSDEKQAMLAEELAAKPTTKLEERLGPLPNPEQQAKQPDVYYISEKGTIWSPMREVGAITDNQGNVKKYILGDLNDSEKVTEVPADWFDAYKGTLQNKEGESFSMTGKPTLETPVVSREADAERSKAPQVVREELGHGALGASGIERPESKSAQLDGVLDKAPVLRHFESELKQIAAMRKREDKEGYKHGMSQFDSSERMIDDLLKIAGQVEKPKSMSEDRRGAIYRYIDLT